jgi:REP element-mobilizing transposase RayT
MPRPFRIRTHEFPYHVTTRGVRKLPTHHDDLDFLKFEALLQEVMRLRGWKLHTYCLMPNHHHLVFHTPRSDISEGMCWLNGVYARWFNWRHGLSGHVFEARFHTELVESDAHLLELGSYVPLNPVRAGLCSHPAEWNWSSYRATTGKSAASWFDPTWLLGHFGRDRATAERAYEQHVVARLAA